MQHTSRLDPWSKGKGPEELVGQKHEALARHNIFNHLYHRSRALFGGLVRQKPYTPKEKEILEDIGRIAEACRQHLQQQSFLNFLGCSQSTGEILENTSVLL